jgi:segregation and condensation protein A
MAVALAERLRKLELIRLAADRLTQRGRLGRDMFLRGGPEGIETISQPKYEAKLYDLLAAYARQRQKSATARVVLKQRNVWSLAEARDALERLAGVALEWTVLDDFLLQYCADMQTARTVRASAFTASLEMVREGRFDMRQDRPFAPLWVRRRPAEPVLDRESLGSP